MSVARLQSFARSTPLLAAYVVVLIFCAGADREFGLVGPAVALSLIPVFFLQRFELRRFSILWLMLLTAYVAALAYSMAGILDLKSACLATTFWLAPAGLSLFIGRRLTLAIWCAAIHIATYVLLTEAFYFNFRHGWDSVHYVLAYTELTFWWTWRVFASYQGHLLQDDDILSAALVGTVIFPCVGVALSLFTRPARDPRRARAEECGAPAGRPGGQDVFELNPVADFPAPSARRLAVWLRNALVMATILTMGAGWVSHQRNAVRARQQSFDVPGVLIKEAMPQPLWRRLLLGSDAARYAVQIWLTGPEIDDDVLASLDLESAADLSEIILGAPRVTDAGLVHIGRLTRLELLEIHAALVTDAGLAHIGRLIRLKLLDIRSTSVTDAGLSHVAMLTALQRLDLTGAPITDAGLVQLAKLWRLKQLFVSRKNVTAAGLANLQSALPGCTITAR